MIVLLFDRIRVSIMPSMRLDRSLYIFGHKQMLEMAWLWAGLDGVRILILELVTTAIIVVKIAGLFQTGCVI